MFERKLVPSLVVVAVAVFAAVASTEDNEAQRVDTEDAAAGSGDNGDNGDNGSGGDGDGGGELEEFVVGDLVELGDWQVQVHAVTDPLESSNEFVQPAEGNRFVAIDVEVTNVGDSPETVSSMLCFEIMDDQNQAHQQTITVEPGSATPDGEVAAGGSRRGTIEYEVPGGAAGLRLNFSCDLFATGTATILL